MTYFMESISVFIFNYIFFCIVASYQQSEFAVAMSTSMYLPLRLYSYLLHECVTMCWIIHRYERTYTYCLTKGFLKLSIFIFAWLFFYFDIFAPIQSSLVIY